MIKSLYKIYSHCPSMTSHLCQLPYPKHRKGCPNNGKRKCRPLNILDFIDINKPMFLIMVSFHINDFAKIMKIKHPNLSYNQRRNLRYWQPIHKRLLKDEIIKFKQKHSNYFIINNPEQMGVDITETVKFNTGIKLDWNYPLNKVWRIAIAGIKR